MKRVEKQLYGRRRTRRWAIITAIAVLVLVLLPFAVQAGKLSSLVREARAAKQAHETAKSAFETQDFSAATLSLDETERRLVAAAGISDELVLIKRYPFVSRQFEAVDGVIEVGVSLVTTARKLSMLASDIVMSVKTEPTLTLSSLSPEQKRVVLQKIYESQPELAGMQAEIELTVGLIGGLPAGGLVGPIGDAVDLLRTQIPTFQTAFDYAVPLSQALPAIAGYPDEKTYLFLLQNNRELRPAGGFIGTYGIVKSLDGDISHFDTNNVYNLDETVKDTLDVTPPEPIERYMSQDHWYLRDANWSPDFPTAADQSLWFYEREAGVSPADMFGVIAVTPTFIEKLLTLTGEVAVDGITFTTENAVDTIEYQVERGYLRQGVPFEERKEIIGALSEQLLDRLLALPQSRWGELWQVLSQSSDERHFLMYVTDDDLQSLIVDIGWAGEVRHVEGDYLQYVDANLASLKTDPAVERTIRYTVDLRETSAIAEVSMEYRHTGQFDWKTTRYRTYARALAPEGATLMETHGAMAGDRTERAGDTDTTSEVGRTAFGAFIATEPQTTNILTFRYRLPGTVLDYYANGRYDLFFQKQAGTIAHRYEVRVRSDRAMAGVSALDTIDRISKDEVLISGELRTDRIISIEYH